MNHPTDGAAPRLTVLIVDDEKNIRRTLKMYLEDLQCRVAEASTAQEAEQMLGERPYNLILLDLRLGDVSGLELLPRFALLNPDAAVIVITAYASVDSAVAAMKAGAWDYLPKPFSPAHLSQLVSKLTERLRLNVQLADLKSQLSYTTPQMDLDTASPVMTELLEGMARSAQYSVPILLRGENGTGKSVLARYIHEKSPRRERPFVLVNCPTLSEDLLASELFGHARGAFTGAIREQPGRVEAAEGGTLFLDEIGELSAALQTKFLRFLQDKQFERVGESKTRTSDVRVIAATNRDLDSDVAAGRFRQDLFFRLNTVELLVPPLRERREDILQLAKSFAHFLARTAGLPEPELSPEVQRLLLEYSWPGNVRELRNAVERAVIFAHNKTILEMTDFPIRLVPNIPTTIRLGGEYTLEDIEREHIAQVLAHTDTQEEAARILGIDASTLWRKRKKLQGS